MTMKELAEKIKTGKPLTNAERAEANALLREKMAKASEKFKEMLAKKEGQ